MVSALVSSHLYWSIARHEGRTFAPLREARMRKNVKSSMLGVALASILAFGEPLRAEPPATETTGTSGSSHAAERRGLGGHVLPALARATRIPRAASARAGSPGPTQTDEPITLTIVL